jgi:hypothetical protein
MRAPRTCSQPRSRNRRRDRLDRQYVHGVVKDIFGPGLHELRVLSLANGVTGVMNAAVLSLHAIGQAYARVAEISAKSGVKQMDRVVGNSAISVEEAQKRWASYIVGERKAIVVALDWTDFEKDDHSTLAAYLMTSHGRATPLMWRTVKKSALKDRRNEYEYELVERLHDALPEDVAITLLADRGFGDQKLYAHLGVLGWDYVIRFRGVIAVENKAGESRPAEEWVPATGRPLKIGPARVTAKRAEVPAVVVVHAKAMKEAWCLATSLADRPASEIVKLYSRRFTIEETFRDQKDIHFGMGLSATHIKNADRRDRLMLLAAVAQVLLTLLGAASEASGLDRYLKVNTSKKRTHSLFRQGLYWYECIPTMREEWLRRLMDAFDRIVREQAFFREVFGVV